MGQLSSIAGLPPAQQRAPYRWSVESSAFISFKLQTSGANRLLIPYQDYYVQWTAPELRGGDLRLEARANFTRENTLHYYGLGNASPAPAPDVFERDFFGRTHPQVWARLRHRASGSWQVGVGAYYTHSWLYIPATSTLAAQMATGDAEVRRILGQPGRHGVLLIEALALFDTRDDEIDTERGQFHQVKVRASPAISGEIPYAYQQINLSSRFFLTVVPDRLVLAARLMGDLLLGDPPFYELARYDDTNALGGSNGVRGVPGQRYYGKVKVVTNWEARIRLGGFKVGGKPLAFGLAGFVDVGRAWTELGRAHPELDGTGWGLKYGLGGGLRLTQGKTFVVRGDVAWSPDARPVGGYVNAGQLF